MIREDSVEEAQRLLEGAVAAGLPVRAVGGVAVWLRAPSLREADPPRVFHDIDLVGSKRTARELEAWLVAEGYEPHRRFNTLAGDRLLFFDESNQRRIDVFLDRLEMCHTLDLTDRITLEPETLPLSDLLLTKLQIVRLTDRDIVDVAALLADHPLCEDDRSGIGVDRILDVCTGDWGWWRTATGNLEHLQAVWEGAAGAGPDRAVASARARELRGILEDAPKSLKWKVRAKVGERMSWYQEPEEVR